MSANCSPQSFLVAQQLFFELEVREPIVLHAYNGSALRGMLYRAMLALVNPETRAPDLRFVPDPLIRRLMAEMDEDNARGQDLPRPYVIEPPPALPGDDHRLEAGQTLSFGITLFGDAREAFPILVMAIKHAESSGLGRFLSVHAGARSRGRFRLVRAFAYNPLTCTSQEVIAPERHWVLTPQVCITHDDIARQAALDAESQSRRLRIHFHTPMTLKAQGQIITQPRFNVLIHRLIERLSQLSATYGGDLLPCLPATREAKNALLRQADAVQRIADHTRWVTVRGHSDRTGASTNLSGFIGSADFEGDFAPFFQMLRWGELSHAGHHAVKGNGVFRIQVL